MRGWRASRWRCWRKPGRTAAPKSPPRSRSRTARCSSGRPSLARRPRSTGSDYPNRSRLGRRLRRLGAFVHAVVAHDLGDAQAIVAKDAGAAGALGLAVLLVAAPARDRRFVAPEGQRQDLAFLGQALEAFDRDEAIDLFEFGSQLRGDFEIVLAPLRFRLDLENDRIHTHSLRLDPGPRLSARGGSG